MTPKVQLYCACAVAGALAVLAAWNYTQGLTNEINNMKVTARLDKAILARDTHEFNYGQLKRDYDILKEAEKQSAKAESNAKTVNDFAREARHAIPKSFCYDRPETLETLDAINDARMRVRLHYEQLGGKALTEAD